MVRSVPEPKVGERGVVRAPPVAAQSMRGSRVGREPDVGSGRGSEPLRGSRTGRELDVGSGRGSGVRSGRGSGVVDPLEGSRGTGRGGSGMSIAKREEVSSELEPRRTREARDVRQMGQGTTGALRGGSGESGRGHGERRSAARSGRGRRSGG